MESLRQRTLPSSSKRRQRRLLLGKTVDDKRIEYDSVLLVPTLYVFSAPVFWLEIVISNDELGFLWPFLDSVVLHSLCAASRSLCKVAPVLVGLLGNVRVFGVPA